MCKKLEQFMKQLEEDTKPRKGQVVIDNYMKDLKIHALQEYEKLHERDINANKGSDSKNKRKRKKDRQKRNQLQPKIADLHPN